MSLDTAEKTLASYHRTRNNGAGASNQGGYVPHHRVRRVRLSFFNYVERQRIGNQINAAMILRGRTTQTMQRAVGLSIG